MKQESCSLHRCLSPPECGLAELSLELLAIHLLSETTSLIARVMSRDGLRSSASLQAPTLQSPPHCSCDCVEFNARGRVLVRILHQEQKASADVGPGINRSPRCIGECSKRVPRGGAHDDQRKPLQPQRCET